MKSLLHGLLGKTLQLVGYTVQYNCVAHCVFEHVGGAVMYSGLSMEPTIKNSDVKIFANLQRILTFL